MHLAAATICASASGTSYPDSRLSEATTFEETFGARAAELGALCALWELVQRERLVQET